MDSLNQSLQIRMESKNSELKRCRRRESYHREIKTAKVGSISIDSQETCHEGIEEQDNKYSLLKEENLQLKEKLKIITERINKVK